MKSGPSWPSGFWFDVSGTEAWAIAITESYAVVNSWKNIRVFQMACSAIMLNSCTSVSARTENFPDIEVEITDLRSIEHVESWLEYDVKISNRGSRAICARGISINSRDIGGFSIDIFDREGQSLLDDNQGFILSDNRSNLIIQIKDIYLFNRHSFLVQDANISDVYYYLIRMDLKYCDSGQEIIIYRTGVL